MSRPAWSAAYLQGVALDAAAALEQLGEVEADGLKTTPAELFAQILGCLGKHQVRAIANGVETEDLCIFRCDQQGAGNIRRSTSRLPELNAPRFYMILSPSGTVSAVSRWQ